MSKITQLSPSRVGPSLPLARQVLVNRAVSPQLRREEPFPKALRYAAGFAPRASDSSGYDGRLPCLLRGCQTRPFAECRERQPSEFLRLPDFSLGNDIVFECGLAHFPQRIASA